MTKSEREAAKLARQAEREEKRRLKVLEMRAKLNVCRQQSLAQYRQNADVIKGVQILIPQNACSICQQFKDRVFDVFDVPPLPDEKCLINWCRCSYVPKVL